MRRLIEATLVSLDGVVENPSQWAVFDAESAQSSLEQLERCDAFILGRKTYEIFVAMWSGSHGDPYLDRLNAMPKYVASRTLTDLQWNASLITGDVADAIRALKAEPGGDLIKYGTSELDTMLIREQLIDEFQFWISPVVVGAGGRLFAGTQLDDLGLRLVRTKVFGNGSVLLTYLPAWA
jgi:dihydrofolate reductase